MKNNKFALGFLLFLIIIAAILALILRPKITSQPAKVESAVQQTELFEQSKNKEKITDIYKLSVVKNPVIINWRTREDMVKICNVDSVYIDPNSVDACADLEKNTIEMSFEAKQSKKEFVLHHEIGHMIYRLDFPKDIFKQGVFLPDYELVAEDFAWWIYNQTYTDGMKLPAEKIKYFEQTCNMECVKDILEIKIR